MRVKNPRALICSAMCIAALAVLIVGGQPTARGVDKEVVRLQKLCESPGAPHRKAMAMQKLCDMDTADARDALKALTAVEDDKTAVLALAALGREGFSSGTDKVKSVMGDTKRSDFVRAGAMAAFCERAKRDEKAWSEISATLTSKAGDDQVLKDQMAALQAKLWTKGGAK